MNKNQNDYYLIFFFGLGFLGAPLLLACNDLVFYAINGFLKPALGMPMLFLTSIADGFFILMLMALLHPLRRREFLPTLFAFLLSAIIVQGIKHTFPIPRPLFALPAGSVDIMGMHLTARTFPSGHSTSAFVFVFFLAHNQTIKIKSLVFLFGILAAISMVYIGVHFPLDVWVGSFIGYFTAWMCSKTFEFLRQKNDDHPRWAVIAKWFRKPGILISSLWGLTVAFIYLFVYEEKTKDLEFILTPVVWLLSGWFLIRTTLEARKLAA